MDALSISNLTKRFGHHKILDQLNMNVSEGSIFGFVGKNGTGKTTTMRIVCGLLPADSGQVRIFQKPVQFGKSDTNQYIGYLPDVPEFYKFMTAQEYLKLCGEITELPSERIRKKSDELLELVGLSDVKKRIGAYSRGMKQRLGIAQALLHEPRLLICDEPTSALDPVGRIEILNILSKLRERTTVIFSTHILADVEKICDTIGILNQGKIVLSGNLKELKNRHRHNKIAIDFFSAKDLHRFAAAISRTDWQSEVNDIGTNINIKTSQIEKTVQEVMQMMITLSLAPQKIEVIEPKLEDIFLEAVR